MFFPRLFAFCKLSLTWTIFWSWYSYCCSLSVQGPCHAPGFAHIFPILPRELQKFSEQSRFAFDTVFFRFRPAFFKVYCVLNLPSSFHLKGCFLQRAALVHFPSNKGPGFSSRQSLSAEWKFYCDDRYPTGFVAVCVNVIRFQSSI